MNQNRKMTTYQMAVSALMAAVMCILGPMSIPIGAVPVSFTNLCIYLAVMLLGGKFGAISYTVYFLLGLVGLPVFSGYSGGLGKLAGPTGGYLVGFFFTTLICGAFLKITEAGMFAGSSAPADGEKTGAAGSAILKNVILIIGFAIGTLACYLFGTIWFVRQMDCTFAYALSVCVFPFLIADLAKIVLAVLLGGLIRGRLAKAGLQTIR